MLFCHQDNLNTDGIYPGKYTYNDAMTLAEMAAVVMENYDPAFGKLLKQVRLLTAAGDGRARDGTPRCRLVGPSAGLPGPVARFRTPSPDPYPALLPARPYPRPVTCLEALVISCGRGGGRTTTH